MWADGLAQPVTKSLRYFGRAGQPSEPQAIRQPCRQMNPGLRGLSLANMSAEDVPGGRFQGRFQLGPESGNCHVWRSAHG